MSAKNTCKFNLRRQNKENIDTSEYFVRRVSGNPCTENSFDNYYDTGKFHKTPYCDCGETLCMPKGISIFKFVDDNTAKQDCTQKAKQTKKISPKIVKDLNILKFKFITANNLLYKTTNKKRHYTLFKQRQNVLDIITDLKYIDLT